MKLTELNMWWILQVNIFLMTAIASIDSTIDIKENSQDILIAVTIGKQSLFLEEFFEKLYQLDYPKKRTFLHIAIQNRTKYHYVSLYTQQWRNEYR